MLRVGIIGVGTAGRARGRALEASDRARCVGTFRGRYASELAAPSAPTPESLMRESDAIIISAPDAMHEALCAQALEHGLHVLVEYPLAMTTEEMARLLESAQQRGCVLHVGHIGLLSHTTRFMCAHGMARMQTGEPAVMHFDSSSAPFEDGPRHAWSQIPRLHRWRALGGSIRCVDTHHLDGAALHATLTFDSGAQAELRARRGAARRRLLWRVGHEGEGPMIRDRTCVLDGRDVPQTASMPLFAQDLDLFLDQIGGQPPSVRPAELLQTGRVAEALGVMGKTYISPPVP